MGDTGLEPVTSALSRQDRQFHRGRQCPSKAHAHRRWRAVALDSAGRRLPLVAKLGCDQVATETAGGRTVQPAMNGSTAGDV